MEDGFALGDFDVCDSGDGGDGDGDGDGHLDWCTRRRPSCPSCERPRIACWCPFLPSPKVRIDGRVLILQHPGEAKRGVRTALMAARGIHGDRCRIVVGRKFPGEDQELRRALEDPDTHLLYPGEDSKELTELQGPRGRTLVVLDGTWDEAKCVEVQH